MFISIYGNNHCKTSIVIFAAWCAFFIVAVIATSVHVSSTNIKLRPVPQRQVSLRNWQCSYKRWWSFYSDWTFQQRWYDLSFVENTLHLLVYPLKPNSLNCYTLLYKPNLPFLISDIRALWCSALSTRLSKVKNGKKLGLYSGEYSNCYRMMTLGFKGLTHCLYL